MTVTAADQAVLPGMPEPIEPPRQAGEDLSYTRKLTIRRLVLLSRGINPATGKDTVLDGRRCRDCPYLSVNHRSRRNYYKCQKNPRGITFGPATDIRVSWPACELIDSTEGT